MLWLLIRVGFVLLLLWLAYSAVFDRFQAVKRHYSWMHPDPMSAL